MGKIAWMYLSFGIPAFIVWGVASAVLHSVPDSAELRVTIAVSALIAGFLEVAGRYAPIFSSTWQVPSSWVSGKTYWLRCLIWGAFLGPGFVTRNSLAGTWLLVASLIPLTHAFGMPTFLMGGMIGVGQSSGRVAGITRQILGGRIDHMKGIIRQMRARRIDGLVLVLLGATLIASLGVT